MLHSGGAALTIVSEESSSCGHAGRVCRVFWRNVRPWVLVRLQDGVMLSVPWAWTNLPVTAPEEQRETDESATVLLSTMALREMVRRVRELRERDRGDSCR